ncbi:MAG: hypothetical protein CMJ31_00270 [Phycisphaerae bacterium]|nr:hypothetical protein [Phycisphaerae bacterium]
MSISIRGALAVASLAGVAASSTLAQTSFSVVALPDTQNYVNSSANAPLFTIQTQWIADQIQRHGNPRNIVFTTHLGDIVSSGSSATQWNRAEQSMDILDAVIAYSALPGNHDFADTGNKSSGTDEYVARFGPSRFEGRSYYGGADLSGNNSYQVFTGAGREFLHIALEWQPALNVTNGPTRDPSPIAWARQVIREHPGMPTIVSTHEHVDDDPPGRSGAGS